MLRLVLRRGRAQWPLLASLLAVVTVGTTLLGVCALLMSRTAGQAVSVAAARAPVTDLDATAYSSDIAAEDAPAVVADTRTLLTSAMQPFRSTLSARAASDMSDISGRSGKGYLAAVDGLPSRATLVDGAWPQGAGETLLLEPTATRLRLSPGDHVRVGDADLTVTGIATADAGTGWDRDLLEGAGYDPDYSDIDSLRHFPAYGPFLISLDDLLARHVGLTRLEITAQPDLTVSTQRDLDTVTDGVLAADRRYSGVLGDRAHFTRVASTLPHVLLTAKSQQRVTDGAVLAVAVIGIVLTGTALALAGRLTAGVRAAETDLLTALGTSRLQLLRTAAIEAVALALLAAALALPLSSLLHAALSHVAPLADAGLSNTPAVTKLQVLSVVLGALALTVVLLTPFSAQSRARVGIDLLLAVFAAAGWWQLRAVTGSADLLQVLAPALLLTAGATLSLRLIPPGLALADRLAQRSRALPVPLAMFEAARRPRATAAGLLLCLACAAATFGAAFDATWARSQRDQAALTVGTDIAVTTSALDRSGPSGSAVSEATGGVVSPVVNRGIPVGQWLGGSGAAPRLVAVDMTRASSLLRGRLDGGRTWSSVATGLIPARPATGIEIPADATITLTAATTVSIPAPIIVTPHLLLQDAAGRRTPCVAPPMALDGRSRPLTGCGGGSLIAISLPFTFDGYAETSAPFTVTMTVTGSADWSVTSAEPVPGQLTDPALTTAGGKLVMTGQIRLGGPPEAARTLVATTFADPGVLPVAVSTALADGLGVAPGSQLTIAVGTTTLPVRIAAVVPGVPSAPGAAALLADVDMLSRALAVRGDFATPVDGWWIGEPTRPDAAGRLAALHLGTVTTRAAETSRLAAGPLRAGLPAALHLLIPAAVLLLLAGVVLHVTYDLRTRRTETSRLRGMGLTRREIRTTLLAQHAVALLPLLAMGAAVGALATRLLTPLLVRSDTGAVPVPGVVPLWPWPTESTLLAFLLVAVAGLLATVVLLQTARSTAAPLRELS
ncbi:FtsX-like permease family protein [Actinoplanes sp. NPDC051851]|uniref:FtsX-like permease family protein n=1 Tax=Actinoplanes sp. NPDC051851 TaxID=3154753 RepID=UPI003430A7BB